MMISDSLAMARTAVNFTLALAVRQNARSVARDLPPEVTPKAHRLRRCRAASFCASMVLRLPYATLAVSALIASLELHCR